MIELYRLLSEDGVIGEQVRTLLAQTHWYSLNAEFDPKTGEALPQALSAFLIKVARPETKGSFHDRLWRITEHARPSVERLFRALNESPRREQAMLPVRAVRELDATSFIKLSNRPGRNIREKLAGKPYLQAVHRFQSVNLPENRLLKAFVTRLGELLELRQDCLGEEGDELLPKIRSWLLSSDARGISHWDNLPPNNTLLSHRDYSCVWDSWCWLQTLDDDIARDFSQLEVRDQTMRLWNDYAQTYREEKFRFADMPVLFNYEVFSIRTWNSEINKVGLPISRTIRNVNISSPVCVDLTYLRPHYSCLDNRSQVLEANYLWQQWGDNNRHFDMVLFTADAAYLHTDATSISSTDLFFSKGNTSENLDRAARAFADRLRTVFKNDMLTWLVPDFLNDFELEITRRNLNARFPSAEPLPRSVAALFEQVDYSKIRNDGYSVVVVDTVGGKTCVTKLIARFDQELKIRIPETSGFYWERCPPVVLSHQDADETADAKRCYDMITVNANGKWRDPVPPEAANFIDPNTLKIDSRIGQFAYCINVTHSPVSGGMRLHALQQRADGIPLWRDKIPELSIKGYIDGIYRRFYLVSKDTPPIRPVRGKPVAIKIKALFPLPKGKPFYSFPLDIGENAEELGYSARLDSPEFPLKGKDLEDKCATCELSLTYIYGADEPYKLIFTPLDSSFPPARATWQRTEEIMSTDAPAPAYPEPMTWTDLQRLPKPDSNETNDLLEWALSAIDRLDGDLYIRPRERQIGVINRYWGVDKHSKHFTFVSCTGVDASVFIHENCFVEGFNYEDFGEGDSLSFELLERASKFSGERVASPTFNESAHLRNLDATEIHDLGKRIRKSLYFPFIQVWRDGRSITDKECPEDFSNAAKNKIEYLAGLLKQNEIPQLVKYDLLFLLACLHKDTTDDCIQWITEQIENGNIRDPRTVGFSLGDVSEKWQQFIFSSLASKPNVSAISVFAYAIWREQHFVERFAASELQATLNALSQRMENINSVTLNGDGDLGYGITRDWIRATAETLELLLGLLRTRVSPNPEIKVILQPHQRITKKLAKQVERMTEIVAQSNVNLFSRVQLKMKEKPPGDRTPDLLYALRLYLTNDDGANAIHITSVSDTDND